MESDGMETVYGTQEETHVMSENVRSLAANIYKEFERLILNYDENVVKELMPLVVGILESLDQSVQERQEIEIELDLLREDNEQLLTQYEREKQLRKLAEQRFLEFEDVTDEERKQQGDKLDSLESIVRMFEIKMKNAHEQITRLEEKDVETKKEFAKLHERYTDLFKAHVDYKERTRLLMGVDRQVEIVNTPSKRLSPTMFMVPHSAAVSRSNHVVSKPLSGEFTSLHFDEASDLPPTSVSVQQELKNTSTGPRGDELGKSPSSHTTPAATVSTVVATVQHVVDVAHMEEQAGDVEALLSSVECDEFDVDAADRTSAIDQAVMSSLYDELSRVNSDAIGNMDFGADIIDIEQDFDRISLGMSREVENLIQENNELLATKNALNIVKDDLITKVDELTSEKEILREEISSLEVVKNKLKTRVLELEAEVHKLKDALQQKATEKTSPVEDEDALMRKKRFTRVEMARVLMERNMYKERLMELQETVRWTEMIRASREHPDLISEKKKSSLWHFFNDLFSSSNKPSKRPNPVLPTLSYNSSSTRGSVRPVGDPNRPHRERRIGEPSSRAFDFLKDDLHTCSKSTFYVPVNDDSRITDRARHVREQERKMRVRQQTRATALQRDDGRLQAYGWSLPAKFCTSTSAAAGPTVTGAANKSLHVAVPVPVYCRPITEDASVKLWCASAVNLSGGKTSDGGTVVGTSIFYKDVFSKPPRPYERPPSDEVEKLSQELQEQEKDIRDIANQQTSSLVWICTMAHNSSEVTVIDANSPGDVLENFRVCSARVLCIASIPGAVESDYTQDNESIKVGQSLSDTNNTSFADEDECLCPVGHIRFVSCVAGCNSSTCEPSTENPEKVSTGGAEDNSRLVTADEVEETLVGANPASTGSSTDRIPTTSNAGRRLLHSANSDMVKDGTSTMAGYDDIVRCEMEKLMTILPTMWLGAQNGRLYVHSSVTRWKRCLYSVQLPDAIVAISHVKGRVFVALSNGCLAVFCRANSGQWEFGSYHLLTLGEPTVSVRCMTVVANQRLWAGHRNRIHILDPKTLQIENSFDAHPRQESQVRQMVWVGEGVWVSIRLDSTLRLYHAYTFQHLQDVDVEPYVSKLLGADKLGFSFVRISSISASCNRLWVGTGNGVIISVPLSETSRKPVAVPSSTGVTPSGVIRVYGNNVTDSIFPGSFIPYCNITQAQLSFHGHKDAVKFFVAVPGQPTNCLSGVASTSTAGKDVLPAESKDRKQQNNLQKTVLVISGGEGYVDFRLGDVDEDEAAVDVDEPRTSVLKTERSHLIVWQVFTDS